MCKLGAGEGSASTLGATGGGSRFSVLLGNEVSHSGCFRRDKHSFSKHCATVALVTHTARSINMHLENKQGEFPLHADFKIF